MTGPPTNPTLSSTSYSMPLTIAYIVSLPTFNLPPCLSLISEKSPLFSPPSVSDVKGKMRTNALHTVSYTADLPHPLAPTIGTMIGTSSCARLGIDQLKLEGPPRYFGG